MTIINFNFPRTPCLTGFENLTIYTEKKMSQWTRPPLLVKFLNQKKTKNKPFCLVKNPHINKDRNHPQASRATSLGQEGTLEKH